MRKKVILSCLTFLLIYSNGAFSLNLDRLSETDIKKVKNLMRKLSPFITQRRSAGTLSTLTFKELYAPLNKSEKDFLLQFQKLDAKQLDVKIPYRGIAYGKEKLAKIKGQKIKDRGKPMTLPMQFLPEEVFKSFKTMMDAMMRDIGKVLYVESGYRSSAYQLYLFVYYLKNHDYSIRETVKFVALPGYSEHGSPTPRNQAVDFINRDGINGDGNPKAFEDLDEYKWLTKNAHKYGFVLSYPKDAGKNITYEPWHWRYEK